MAMSNGMPTEKIIEIMRTMARNERNRLGEYWHYSFCNFAADEIERLRAELDALQADRIRR